MRTYVLVHGAFHGGWCWQRVADRLRARGHTVYTPDPDRPGGTTPSSEQGHLDGCLRQRHREHARGRGTQERVPCRPQLRWRNGRRRGRSGSGPPGAAGLPRCRHSARREERVRPSAARGSRRADQGCRRNQRRTQHSRSACRHVRPEDQEDQMLGGTSNDAASTQYLPDRSYHPGTRSATAWPRRTSVVPIRSMRTSARPRSSPRPKAVGSTSRSRLAMTPWCRRRRRCANCCAAWLDRQLRAGARCRLLFLGDVDRLARNQLVAGRRRLDEEEVGTGGPKDSASDEQKAICSVFCGFRLGVEYGRFGPLLRVHEFIRRIRKDECDLRVVLRRRGVQPDLLRRGRSARAANKHGSFVSHPACGQHEGGHIQTTARISSWSLLAVQIG